MRAQRTARDRRSAIMRAGSTVEGIARARCVSTRTFRSRPRCSRSRSPPARRCPRRKRDTVRRCGARRAALSSKATWTRPRPHSHALAESSGGDAAAHYRLRAAEAQREAGDLDGAARELGDVKRRRLHGAEQVRLDLLDAEIALKHGDAGAGAGAAGDAGRRSAAEPARHARSSCGRAPKSPPAIATRPRARARELDRYLDGADRDQNRKEIIDTLAALDAEALKTRAETLQPDDPLRPWIEQALRAKGRRSRARCRGRTARSARCSPDTPARTKPKATCAAARRAAAAARRAARAPFRKSIRDGFLAAYFASDDAHRPDVRIYDSGKTPADAIAAYKQAVADGADHVVGPLQREAVGELFHQHADGARARAQSSRYRRSAAGRQRRVRPSARRRRRAGRRAHARTRHRARGRDHRRHRLGRARGARVPRAVRGERRQHRRRSAAARQRSQFQDADPAGDSQRSAMRPTPASSSACVRSRRASCCRSSRSPASPRPCSRLRTSTRGDANPGLDRDLDGVEFCDAPWLFGPVPGRPDRDLDRRARSRARTASARASSRSAWMRTRCCRTSDWLLAHPDCVS